MDWVKKQKILLNNVNTKLKDLLNERYVSKRSDTIEEVYQSAVDSLEDLSDLIKKQTRRKIIISL